MGRKSYAWQEGNDSARYNNAAWRLVGRECAGHRPLTSAAASLAHVAAAEPDLVTAGSGDEEAAAALWSCGVCDPIGKIGAHCQLWPPAPLPTDSRPPLHSTINTALRSAKGRQAGKHANASTRDASCLGTAPRAQRDALPHVHHKGNKGFSDFATHFSYRASACRSCCAS
jgi:hypothetical protein